MKLLNNGKDIPKVQITTCTKLQNHSQERTFRQDSIVTERKYLKRKMELFNPLLKEHSKQLEGSSDNELVNIQYHLAKSMRMFEPKTKKCQLKNFFLIKSSRNIENDAQKSHSLIYNSYATRRDNIK